MTIEERFWSKVDKRGPDDCWEWKASLGRGGYGHFWPTRRKTMQAHRMAYELHYKIIVPKTTWVCHTCDNPKCCNPTHLFLGTPKDNTQDMLQKHRHRTTYGESHYFHKLTDAQVTEIRLLGSIKEGSKPRTGMRPGQLAVKYNVTPTHIYYILRKLSRKTIQGIRE